MPLKKKKSIWVAVLEENIEVQGKSSLGALISRYYATNETLSISWKIPANLPTVRMAFEIRYRRGATAAAGSGVLTGL